MVVWSKLDCNSFCELGESHHIPILLLFSMIQTGRRFGYSGPNKSPSELGLLWLTVKPPVPCLSHTRTGSQCEY